MFYWRLLSITLLIIGLFLFGKSLIEQNLTLFYFSFASYGLASVIWLTIEKLYTNFRMPKNPQNNRNTVSSYLDNSDIFIFIDMVLSFPKSLFLLLIHAIYN